MLLADTTFLVDLSSGDPGALAAAQRLDATGEVLVTSFINAFEFLLGNGARSQAARARGLALLDGLVVLFGDRDSAALSAQAGAQLLARGQAAPAVDLLIAGIALREGATILTRDQDFARIPGLAVQSY